MRKSFHIWNSNLFDVTMGTYDGAEICELVGLFILNNLGEARKTSNYTETTVWQLLKLISTFGRQDEKKSSYKVFEQFGLKITAEAYLHVVNFLDVTFDLTSEKYKPYTRKPNDDDPLYIHKHCNHPPNISRQLPTSINKRISALSSEKQTGSTSISERTRTQQLQPRAGHTACTTTTPQEYIGNAISFN